MIPPSITCEASRERGSKRLVRKPAASRGSPPWLLRMAALGLSLVLAACGGSAIVPFRPTQMMIFGDELSLIRADGRKYGVNALNSDGVTLDCAADPIWVQSLVSIYGLVLDRCNPSSLTPTAFTYSAPMAKAADIEAQVAQAQAFLGLGDKQVATVFVGLHDVLEGYDRYLQNPSDKASVMSELKQRGQSLADRINRLALSGPAVFVITAPDISLTPYGLAQAGISSDRAGAMVDLVNAFNTGLRVALLNDGHHIGLIMAEDMVRDISKVPGLYGIADTTRVICNNLSSTTDSTVRDFTTNCTTSTLVPDANLGNWSWADNIHFGPALHTQLGNRAQLRTRNPF